MTFIGPGGPAEANYEPASAHVRAGKRTPGLRPDITRMRAPDVGIGTRYPGILSPGLLAALGAWLAPALAFADPVGFIPTQTSTESPPRSTQPAPVLRPTWDLDGTYLWLGPIGAASRIDGQWDTTFGGDATVIRIREHDVLGAIGGTFGASRYTVRDGGQIWLDGLLGTEVGGHMLGLSFGPILEIAQLAHPEVGGSIGVWGFVGVAPYVRVGVVETLGAFAEFGVHIALPVIRR